MDGALVENAISVIGWGQTGESLIHIWIYMFFIYSAISQESVPAFNSPISQPLVSTCCISGNKVYYYIVKAFLEKITGNLG